MRELLPIKLIRPGSTVHIAQIDGKPGEIQRLEELGLRQGSEVEVLQPGCPCIVRCRGAKLCLRGNDCLCVFVHAGVAEPSSSTL